MFQPTRLNCLSRLEDVKINLTCQHGNEIANYLSHKVCIVFMAFNDVKNILTKYQITRR